MAKIYNVPGIMKKCFLLTVFVSAVVLSYSQTMNQEPINENQGSSIATLNQTEKMNWKRRYQILVESDINTKYLAKIPAELNSILHKAIILTLILLPVQVLECVIIMMPTFFYFLYLSTSERECLKPA